jgi:hypothetical protein
MQIVDHQQWFKEEMRILKHYIAMSMASIVVNETTGTLFHEIHYNIGQRARRLTRIDAVGHVDNLVFAHTARNEQPWGKPCR